MAGWFGAVTWFLFLISFAVMVPDPGTLTQPENSPPVVNIVAPRNNSVHPLNTLVPYSISVTDREDGESKYDEIPTDKIFLEIRYVEGTPTMVVAEAATAADPPGLSAIKASDCFTCHQFRSRLIGPSFVEIASRYAGDPNARTLLATRIRGGSQNVWGKAIMPSHPEIDSEQAQRIAGWILEAGLDENLNYLPGKDGAFLTALPPGAHKGYFILKATYTDSGLREQPDQAITGHDLAVIRHQ